MGEVLARSFRPGRDGHRRRRRSPGCGGLEPSGALALILEAGGGMPALEGGFLPAGWVGPEQGTPLSAVDLGEDDGPADGVSGGSPAPASFPASSLHGGAGRRRPLAVPLLAGVSAPVREVIEPARRTSWRRVSRRVGPRRREARERTVGRLLSSGRLHFRVGAVARRPAGLREGV